MCNWRPIPEYEGFYEVNEDGIVRSIIRRFGGDGILKQATGNTGYKFVSLCKNGKQKSVNVHRIVAKVFIPNPDNLPCVNHKDENKENNSVSNLEWCSYYSNNVYGNRLTKSAVKRSIPIRCVETGKIFSSAYAAQRETGILQSKICLCCHGLRKTTGGFHWEFV